MPKGIVAVLVLLLVAELATATAIVAAQPGGLGSLATVNWGPERRQEIAAKVYDLNGQPATVNINNPNGRVEISGDANLSGVQVSATKIIHSFNENEFDRVRFNVEQNGSTIKIEGNRSSAPSMFGFSDQVLIRVSAPPALLASLTTDTGSGDLSLTRIKNEKVNFNLKTGSGSIRVEGIQAANLILNSGSGDIRATDYNGLFEARTGSGSVSADGIQGISLVLSTGSGDIRGSSLKGALNAKTGSGSIDIKGDTNLTNGLRLETGSGDIRMSAKLTVTSDGTITTGSGSVRLNLAGGAAPGFDISTNSGSIRVGLPNTNFTRQEKHAVRTGGSPVINVRTGSGDVEIK